MNNLTSQELVDRLLPRVEQGVLLHVTDGQQNLGDNIDYEFSYEEEDKELEEMSHLQLEHLYELT